MKLFLLSLCLFLTVATALVPRRTRNRDEFSKKDEEILKLASYKRVFKSNDTIPMRSAKLTRDVLNQKPSPRHSEIEIKQFETRLDHLSSTDLRTVEFVSFWLVFSRLNLFINEIFTELLFERWVLLWHEWGNFYLRSWWERIYHSILGDWIDAWNCYGRVCRFGHSWFEILQKQFANGVSNIRTYKSITII